MNHKEKMNWYKENNPITYYELNSNPTGADESFTFIPVIMLIIIIGGLIYALT